MSDTFKAHAREAFPPGGSVEGKPRWEMFEEGPLVAIAKAFGDNFEGNAEAAPGIRVVMTHALPFFPAMAVYAAVIVDGPSEWVELLDITVDDEYFRLIDDDPLP